MTQRTTRRVLLTIALATTLLSCGGSGPSQPPATTGMEGAVAACAFDVVTLQQPGLAPREVQLNGLPVSELPGADKVAADSWERVTRRGVRVSTILQRAGLTLDDATPVNCVARDGFDPLRTRLGGDTSKLPTFATLRDHGYVYVGSPGDKDPLYPEMEGRSLIVDYDFATDGEVPAALGGKLASLGMFRCKMVEKVDDQQRGVFELDPVVP